MNWDTDWDFDEEAVEFAARLVPLVYYFNSGGGNLHIVLDDRNLGDGSLAFCRQFIAENPLESSPLQLACELACLTAFEGLNEDERFLAIERSRKF